MAPGTYSPYQRGPDTCICRGTHCGGTVCQIVRTVVIPSDGEPWRTVYVEWIDGLLWSAPAKPAGEEGK